MMARRSIDPILSNFSAINITLLSEIILNNISHILTDISDVMSNINTEFYIFDIWALETL